MIYGFNWSQNRPQLTIQKGNTTDRFASLGDLVMKIRFKPALRSRVLAVSVSLGSFVAIIFGFIKESESTPPELSAKQAGTKKLEPREFISSATPLPTGESVSIPSPTSSRDPSAQPANSPNPIAINPSPTSSRKPAQPSNSATPSAKPSVNPTESSEPATPVLPTSPEVDPTSPQEPSIIYTCISPGGNTREPMGSPSCPGKWGYVLTPVPA